MIDWNDNARSAVVEYAAFSGQSINKALNWLRDKPSQNTKPRKTVKDAVDWHQVGNHIGGYKVIGREVLVYCEDNDDYHFVGAGSAAGNGTSDYYIVIGTLEEFEQEVARREGEKWTHFVEDDENPPIKCRKHLKLTGGDDWVYVCEKGDYFVPAKMGFCSVKPIRTLTRAEAEKELGCRIVE